jgi:hypothetical protein
MFANFRRLAIAHGVLGLSAALAYWARPGAFALHIRTPRRALGFLIIIQTFAVCAPYLISGYYACDLLATREPKATLVFLTSAVGVAILADCLLLGLFPLRESPWLVSAGVTLVLLAAARLCAAVWRGDPGSGRSR